MHRGTLQDSPIPPRDNSVRNENSMIEHAYCKKIVLPSKKMLVTLKAPSEDFDGQTKEFLMPSDNGSRLIPVTFDGKKATIPAIKGTGELMVYSVH